MMEDNFELSSKVLRLINEKLIGYSEKLKELQPAKTGSIMLHLDKCGKGCMGCPHPSWRIWKGRKAGASGQVFLGFRIDNPSKYIRRKGEFEKNYEEVRQVILEAKYLIDVRAELLQKHRELGAVLRRVK